NRIDASGAVAAQDRKDIERMSRQIRLSIMRGVWQAARGDPADFEAWVRDPGGHVPNAPAFTFFDRRYDMLVQSILVAVSLMALAPPTPLTQVLTLAVR